METLKLEYLKMKQTVIREFMFADSTAIFADTEKNLQYNLEVLEEEICKTNMKIEIEKHGSSSKKQNT